MAVDPSQERVARLEEALKRMIAVTELSGTRSELSAQTENAKSFARAALAARETENTEGSDDAYL